MKALISPLENNRIAQVEQVEFEVAEPLFWVDCPDFVTPEYTYDSGSFVAPVIPEVTPELISPTKEDLLIKLQELQQQIAALEAS